MGGSGLLGGGLGVVDVLREGGTMSMVRRSNGGAESSTMCAVAGELSAVKGNGLAVWGDAALLRLAGELGLVTHRLRSMAFLGSACLVAGVAVALLVGGSPAKEDGCMAF